MKLTTKRNYAVLGFIFIVFGLQLISCIHRTSNLDLDEAIILAKENNKKLLFISAIKGCDPCDNLLKRIKDNDTLKAALKDYEIVMYSGNLNNLSLANKILTVVQGPGTFVFDQKQTLKSVVWGGNKSIKKYLSAINKSNIREIEKSAFNQLLIISSTLKNKEELNKQQLNFLTSFHGSFFVFYLLYKNSVLLKENERASGYVNQAIQQADEKIYQLYDKEINEMKNFINK
jgi:hypothetical protein